MAFTPATNAARYTPIAHYPTPTAASAAPNPPYTGVFIPAIWSSKLIEKFYDATVLGAIANTDYEGEIQKYGDTINIRTRPSITIKDYAPDKALEVERPSSGLITLDIDQGKYFNLILDDIYRVQSDLDLMNLWATDASEQMKLEVDQNVLAAFPTFVSADNAGTTAGRISNDINLGVTTAPIAVVGRNPGAGDREIVDLILDMALVLDEQNIPETGRFLVLPPWASRMIKSSELRDASLTGDGTSMVRNGRLGMIDRFTIYVSNLLPNPGEAGEHYVLAGSKMGLSFAAQLTVMEKIRSEMTFGELMRGLLVYGFGATKPEAISCAVIAKG